MEIVVVFGILMSLYVLQVLPIMFLDIYTPTDVIYFSGLNEYYHYCVRTGKTFNYCFINVFMYLICYWLFVCIYRIVKFLVKFTIIGIFIKFPMMLWDIIKFSKDNIKAKKQEPVVPVITLEEILRRNSRTPQVRVPSTLNGFVGHSGGLATGELSVVIGQPANSETRNLNGRNYNHVSMDFGKTGLEMIMNRFNMLSDKEKNEFVEKLAETYIVLKTVKKQPEKQTSTFDIL